MISILGQPYEIIVKKHDDDKYFEKKNCDGYCDGNLKQIVVCDMRTLPEFEDESDEYCAASQKVTLRHEIVHAFFNESGLAQCAGVTNSAWSQNEEMVDWIAIQGPKIFAAWQEAGCL